MIELPFDTVGIDADEATALEKTYNLLRSKFNISLPGKIDTPINKFELFNNDTNANIGGSLIINPPTNTCYLNFIKNHFSVSAGGRGGGSQFLNYDKYQVWAFVNMKKDFGRVLIRRKTFTDGLLEIVNHVELKIDGDNQFNSTWHVVADDEKKSKDGLTPELRAVIMAIKNSKLIIEIVNNTLVIGNNELINPELIVYLADLANDIAEVA